MTGGDSKILTEKGVTDSHLDETFVLSQPALSEAEVLLEEISQFAEIDTTFEIDETDIKEAASSAFHRDDIDLLRAYRKCIYDGVDIFEVDKQVLMLRDCGYAEVAPYFTRNTVRMSQLINEALVNASPNFNIDHENAAQVCSYVMTHQNDFGKVLRAISEKGVISYAQITSLVDGSVAPAVIEGVL